MSGSSRSCHCSHAIRQDNGEVLLTVYNAFTTGPELFDSLAAYSAEVTSGENNSAPIQLRYVVF